LFPEISPQQLALARFLNTELLLIYKPNSTVVLNIHNMNAQTSQIKTKHMKTAVPPREQ